MLWVTLNSAPGGTAVGWKCLATDIDPLCGVYWDSVPDGL